MKICFYSQCTEPVPKENKLFCSFKHQIATRNEKKRIARANRRPLMICERGGCENKIGSMKRKFCSDECYNLERNIPLICYQRDNTSFEERAKYILKKKKREALLARVCALSSCTKKLSTMRKKYCSDSHFDQAKEEARAKNNPDRLCKICGVRFKPVFIRNVICKDPACKRAGLEMKIERHKEKREKPKPVTVKKVREAPKVKSNFGSTTRSYSAKPNKNSNNLVVQEYESKVAIDLITKVDLRLSQEAQAIQDFLDSGRKVKKVLFQNGAQSLEFEDMEEFENTTDVSQYGNYSSSWDATKLHN